MFDIGFQELAILFVIGLLVLGPERLPRVARTLGAYVGKARRTWNTVRRDIENELAAEDLKRTTQESMNQVRDQVREVGESLNESISIDADVPKLPKKSNEADA